MSDMEFHKGKLIPVKTLQGETLESVCRRMYLKENITTLYDDMIEGLLSETWNKYVILENKLFKIEDVEYDINDGIYEHTLNSDGSINYMMYFYNGGACLSEMLEKIKL